MGLSNHSWLLILVVVSIVFICVLTTGIVICSRAQCCSCMSTDKKHSHHSPTHMHQRQYSPTSNTPSSSLMKPTDLWAGADCLSPPPLLSTTGRNSNAGERHYESSSTTGSGTLQRCNHHHHHLYHHTQETQPLTNNIELNNEQQRHSYVPSNDGSSSLDGNTNSFSINAKFNNSMRTRPIAVGAPFEQAAQKKSMKNLRECDFFRWQGTRAFLLLAMGTAFIMNHNNLVQQPQHVTVRPIQQKAQYVVRPSDQSHSIGSGESPTSRQTHRLLPLFVPLDPSSPDYQHSPSTSHCSSNHNPPSSMQSNSLAGASLYDKVSTMNNNANTMGDNGNNQRSLLATSKPNLRSFTVPVAPPLIPPPPSVTHKQPTSGGPAGSQCMST